MRGKGRILSPGIWTLYSSRHSRGFTLLEVMLTLFLVALLVGLVVPKFASSDLEMMRLRGLRFRSVLLWLQEQASYTDGIYRLRINFSEQRYWCEIREWDIFIPVADALLHSEPLDPRLGRMSWIPYDNGIADVDEVVVPFSMFGPQRPIMVQFRMVLDDGDSQGFTVSFRPEWWAPRLVFGLLVWEDADTNESI